MALLEQQPVHVRKKIALGITICVGLFLIIVMFLVYGSKTQKARGSDGATTAIGRFYATILSDTQSFFGREHAIISK